MQEIDSRRLIPRQKFRELQGGISRMTLYRRQKTVEGYPAPVFIQKRAYYYADEVERYLGNLPRANDRQSTPKPEVKESALRKAPPIDGA